MDLHFQNQRRTSLSIKQSELNFWKPADQTESFSAKIFNSPKVALEYSISDGYDGKKNLQIRQLDLHFLKSDNGKSCLILDIILYSLAGS